MTHRDVITEDMIQAAFAALDARIAAPVPTEEKRYSRREAFLKLRAKAKEALAAGHSLETVLDDLKGVGLGLTLSTARQYLKPGRKTTSQRSIKRTESTARAKEKTQISLPANEIGIAEVVPPDMRKGTFAVTDDDNDI